MLPHTHQAWLPSALTELDTEQLLLLLGHAPELMSFQYTVSKLSDFQGFHGWVLLLLASHRDIYGLWAGAAGTWYEGIVALSLFCFRLAQLKQRSTRFLKSFQDGKGQNSRFVEEQVCRRQNPWFFWVSCSMSLRHFQVWCPQSFVPTKLRFLWTKFVTSTLTARLRYQVPKINTASAEQFRRATLPLPLSYKNPCHC